jgi:hypothetical protein
MIFTLCYPNFVLELKINIKMKRLLSKIFSIFIFKIKNNTKFYNDFNIKNYPI